MLKKKVIAGTVLTSSFSFLAMESQSFAAIPVKVKVDHHSLLQSLGPEAGKVIARFHRGKGKLAMANLVGVMQDVSQRRCHLQEQKQSRKKNCSDDHIITFFFLSSQVIVDPSVLDVCSVQ